MSPIIRNANLILIFLGGFIVSGLFKDSTVVASIPILAMVGAFLGIIVNRTKHLDDLNLARKKDVSLEFIEDISEYGSVLISLIEPTTTLESYFLEFNKVNKKMGSSMNKFHVVCSDATSSELEEIQFNLIKQMRLMVKTAIDVGDHDKITLMKLFVKDDVFSKLNNIRYEILELVNNEIGDGSGTGMFKRAIEESNVKYKQVMSDMLGVESEI